MISTKQTIELILYKTQADLRTEVARSYLSFLWWALEPMLYMAAFYIVFGLLLQRGNGPEFIPFLLCGLTSWKWFDSGIRASANSISVNHALMRQVDLPKVIFPIISVFVTTFKFLIILPLLLIFLELFSTGFSSTYFLLPVIVLVQMLVIGAAGMTLAAIVPFIPDLQHIIGNVLTATMFMSGIFFSGKDIPVEYHNFFYMNPMATLIESYRSLLLHAESPDWHSLGVISLLSLLIISIVSFLISRNSHSYAKVLG